MITELLHSERDIIQAQIRSMEDLLETLPNGHLLCARNGNYTKYYVSNGSHPKYIPKKSYSLAEALAAKEYYSRRLKELQSELQLMDTLLQQSERHITSNQLLDDTSGYKAPLSSYFRSFPSDLALWMKADYTHNTNHPDSLIYQTLAHHKVRSKSEIIIANALFTNRIPYRYECGLALENVMFFPDFTILHPRTRKIVYWEHFGLISDASYCEKAFNKLKVFAKNNIIPTINLITTYETPNAPIDSDHIQKIINDYLR